MKFPTIQDVSDEVYSHVQDLKNWQIDEGDIRLQVYENGGWIVRTGDASFDTDHSGFWGASSIASNANKRQCRETARELIGQARDQQAESK
jgi:hypothetical protein